MKKLIGVMATAMFLLVAGRSYAQTKKPIAVTDMLKIQSADNIEISPDGQTAIYSVSSIIPNEENKGDYSYKRRIWVVNLSGNYETRLLDTTANIAQPTFSPSGSELAFTKGGRGGQSQIYIYNIATGKTRQVTNFKLGASSPKWSPDGKRLAFTVSLPLQRFIVDKELNPDNALPTWVYAKPGFVGNKDLLPNEAKADPDGDLPAIRSYLAKNETDRKAKVITRLQYQAETGINTEIRISHIFIVDTAVGSNPKALTKGYYSFSNPTFAGNNNIVAGGKFIGKVHPDEGLEEQVYSIKIDGSGFTALLSKPNVAYNIAGVSPSGKWMAYSQSFPGTVNVPTLYITDLQAPESKPYLIQLDRSKGKLKFTEDEKAIYFVATQNGGSSIYKGDWLKGGLQKLTSEDEGINDYDIVGNKLVYSRTTVADPSELYIADESAKNTIQITHLNTEWLAERKISQPQKFTFKNELGLEVEYWVMKPIDFDPSKKYPLLLNMHGGPASMWGPGDDGMWHEFQYYCAKGIGVVYCNPRGSGGYGEKFLKANTNDWGPGPASDVLTALNKTIALGWADTSKLLISGGSYAGYLTAWIISHNNRFLAASSQRGVYDFKTFFGEGNVWRIIPRYFGGYSWDDKTKKILEDQSPINYVKNIHTPLLIFTGESDLRVGSTQSDMLFKSLKVLGRPVELVRHPGGSHDLIRNGDNRQRIDQMLRTYEFFARYLAK